jgi:hypothetical protein
MKLYTYYRRIIAAIFNHFAQEFSQEFRAVQADALAKAEALERALEQVKKDIHTIESNSQIDRLERVFSQVTEPIKEPTATAKVHPPVIRCKG